MSAALATAFPFHSLLPRGTGADGPEHVLWPAGRGRQARFRLYPIMRTKDEHMSRTRLRYAAGLTAATAIGTVTVIAASIGFVSALLPSKAWPHSFYEYRCCHDQDCRPVPGGAIAEGPDGCVIKATGEVIAYADSRVRQSPDGRFHWCSLAGSQMGRTLCLYAPGRVF